MALSTHIRLLSRVSIIVLMTLVSVLAMANEEKGLLTKERASQDIQLYFDLIDKQHGNPYAYISRDEFLSLVDEKIQSLPNQISVGEFSIILSELNQQIRCGHTIVGAYQKHLLKDRQFKQFFPFPVSIIEGELYLDFESPLFPHGSKLKAINGVAASEIKDQVMHLLITDGFIETKRLKELEHKFGYYYFLKFGGSDAFEVDYESPKGQSSQFTTHGVAGNKMLVNHYYRPVMKSHERYHSFTHLDAVDSLRSLVLTLNTFQAHPEWFADRIATRYNEETRKFDFDHLVLDLRQNEGGDRRLLSILYQFIANKNLIDPSETSTRTLDIVAQDQLVAINGRLNSFEVVKNAENYLREHFNLISNDKYASEVLNWYDEFSPEKPAFDLTFEGKVYVLISGRTFSAAADMARILGELDNVVLIGEETGGAYEARTANMLLQYSLPNSEVSVQVPVIYERFVNTEASFEKGRGVFPDYQVLPTYEDLLNSKDTVFEFALQLIQESTSLGTN